jgi:hypothetical protein
MFSARLFRRLALPLAAAALFAHLPTRADVYAYEQSRDTSFGVIDLNTGAITTYDAQGPATLDTGPGGIAVGPCGTLYSVFPSTQDVYTINPYSGAYKLFATDTNISSDFFSIASTSNGSLYGFDYYRNVYRINPQTGAAQTIGNSGIGPVGAYALSVNAPKLYLTTNAQAANGGYALYNVDLTTGLATQIVALQDTLVEVLAMVQINGKLYASDSSDLHHTAGQGGGELTIDILDPTTGATTLLRDLGAYSTTNLRIFIDSLAPLPGSAAAGCGCGSSTGNP